jgi:hypothetical protein
MAYPVAVRGAGVAAIVSLTPATDGLASLLHVVGHAGAGRLMSLAGQGCAAWPAPSPSDRRTFCRSSRCRGRSR